MPCQAYVCLTEYVLSALEEPLVSQKYLPCKAKSASSTYLLSQHVPDVSFHSPPDPPRLCHSLWWLRRTTSWAPPCSRPTSRSQAPRENCSTQEMENLPPPLLVPPPTRRRPRKHQGQPCRGAERSLLLLLRLLRLLRRWRPPRLTTTVAAALDYRHLNHHQQRWQRRRRGRPRSGGRRVRHGKQPEWR